MSKHETESFCPANREEWRNWLMQYHLSKASVWLICYKKKSNRPSLSWSDAVEEALCFGWIDSVRRPIDEDKFMQFFGKRKARGTWSKVNKKKIERLIQGGQMMPAGYQSIEAAKLNGSWTILDKVEELHIPPDLEEAFSSLPGSGEFFSGLSKSARKAILQWLVLAKLPATRQKRIYEIAELAAQQLKPKQFRYWLALLMNVITPFMKCQYLWFIKSVSHERNTQYHLPAQSRTEI